MSTVIWPLAVILSGATGRMGQRVLRMIEAHPGLHLSGALCGAQDPRLGADAGLAVGLPALGVAITADARAAVSHGGVLIDFSAPEGTERVCDAARERRVPAVIGTTGLGPGAMAAVTGLAGVAPVVLAPNTAVGVQVLARLVEEAARLLGSGFDAEVVESHHRDKVDAPSGTARLLVERILRAEGRNGVVDRRPGPIGPRPKGAVGVQSIRGGDVVGDHTVFFLGDGERVELTHRATDRDLFARGALRAATWVAEPGRPAGLYSMTDVLGI